MTRNAALRWLLAISIAVAQSAFAQTDPATVGQWSPVVTWPTTAVHSILEPTGKVLFWGDDESKEDPYEWDPVTNTFTVLPNAGYDIHCGGHTLLEDGKVLVIGGEITDLFGVRNASTWDPFARTWTRLPDMNAPRWYPTATTLPTGEALAIAGVMNGAGTYNRLPQVWQPKTGTWRNLTNAQEALDLYPFMFVAPTGKVFAAGPEEFSWLWDTADAGTVSHVATSLFGTRNHGVAVMYDDRRVMTCGGGDWDAVSNPTATTEVIDLEGPNYAWRSVAPMLTRRRHHTGTLLPDGKVLIVGGISGPGLESNANPVLSTELWNPATETFSALAPISTVRPYHSTAVLLPDGRVLSASGWNSTTSSTAQIFSPPYLFKGARPNFFAALQNVGYGQSFTVSTPDAARIAQVTWVRLGATTHGFNQNQRFNRLSFTRGTASLNVTTPANGNRCPPGHYLMFVIDDQGVPSVGQMIRISGSTTGGGDAGTPDAGSQLDAGAPFDAGSSFDAGVPDAGVRDAGVVDAGAPDAGRPDSGTIDAGTFDAGLPGTTALIFSDTFTRTDSAGLGANWAIVSGLWLTNSRAVSDLDGANQAWARSNACLNCRVEADVVGFGVPETALFVRAPAATPADRYDLVLLSNGNVRIRRVRSGVITNLGEAPSGVGALNATSRLTLSVTGVGPVNLTATVNGVVRLFVTDATNPLTAAGQAGLFTNRAGVWFDNFQLWTLGGGGGVPDAGTPGVDAGTTPDAGTPDAGRPDAGAPDAGRPDAGAPDSGTPDAGAPGQLFFDTFTRIDSSGLGANWASVSGLWLTNSRAISDLDGSNQAWARSNACLNCRVEADVVSFGVPETALFLRAPSATPGNRYDVVLLSNGQLRIRRIRAGVITVLGEAPSGLGALNVPAHLALTATGTTTVTLTATVNGVQRLFVTDSNNPLTAPGQAGISTNRAGVWFDNFQLTGL